MSAPLPPRPPLSGAATALMFLVGIILLLPGLCAGFFAVASLGSSGSNGPLSLLWLICFAVSAGGIAMIARAVQRLRAPDRRSDPDRP